MKDVNGILSPSMTVRQFQDLEVLMHHSIRVSRIDWPSHEELTLKNAAQIDARLETANRLGCGLQRMKSIPPEWHYHIVSGGECAKPQHLLN
jgi:hypothetical protein